MARTLPRRAWARSSQFRRLPHRLAWLDMSALGWGDDPARFALRHAKVALSGGPAFGPQGTGHARINLACAPGTITEAVARLARAAAAAAP